MPRSCKEALSTHDEPSQKASLVPAEAPAHDRTARITHTSPAQPAASNKLRYLEKHPQPALSLSAITLCKGNGGQELSCESAEILS